MVGGIDFKAVKSKLNIMDGKLKLIILNKDFIQ